MLSRVALVCGNGLSIDLAKNHAPSLVTWDTQRPLSWPIPTPGQPATPLMASLPRLKAALNSPSLARVSSDFGKLEAIAALAEHARANQVGPRSHGSGDDLANGAVVFQTRHFLAVAYSVFQAQVDRVDLRAWRWAEWLKRMRGNLELIVSFNYDLVVERACETVGLLFERIQAQPTGAGNAAVLFKPHGSIDFDVSSRFVRLGFTYPFGDRWVVTDCDFPIELARTSDLLNPRMCADIVLPGERSALAQVQWVAPFYRQVKLQLRHVDYCVLAGLSYWLPDRFEIDNIVDALHPTAIVVVANPDPPKDLLRSLERKGRSVMLWTAGPGDLPVMRPRA